MITIDSWSTMNEDSPGHVRRDVTEDGPMKCYPYVALLLLSVSCASAPPPQDDGQIQQLKSRVVVLGDQLAVADGLIAELVQKSAVLEADLGRVRLAPVEPPGLGALRLDAASLRSTIGSLEGQVAAYRALAETDAAELEARRAEIQGLFADEIASGEVQIRKIRTVLVIEVKDHVLFSGDSPALLPGNRDILLKLAGVFKKSPGRIVRVEGNTAVAQSSPETLLRYPTSWHLGAARAANVVAYLQDRGAMDPHQLIVSSLGEYNPAAGNGSEEGRATNRRVEFVLVPRGLWNLTEPGPSAP